MRTEYKTAKVIHIKHMLYTAVSNIRVWLVCAVLFALLFGAKDYMKKQNEAEKQAAQPDVKTQEVTISTEGFYRVKGVTEYEDILKKQQEYNSHSILMKIDPVHKWGCTVKYTFTAADETGNVPAVLAMYLEKLNTSDSFLAMNEALTEKTEESYLREVITFDTSVAGTIAVNIVYFSEEGVEQMRSALSQYAAGLFAQIPEEYGACVVAESQGEIKETVDMQLSTQQNQYRAQLVTTQDSLTSRMTAIEEDEQAYLELYREARLTEGYEDGQPLTKEVPVEKKEIKVSLWSVKKQVVIGAALGFIVGLLLVCVKYIYSRKLLNVQNIEEMYELPVLSTVGKKASIRQEMEMTAVKLLLKDDKSGENRTFAIAGTATSESCKECKQTLMEALKEQDIKAKLIGNLAQTPEEYSKLKEADAVILIEKLGETRFDKLGEMVSLCEEGSRPVAGVIVIE